MGENQTEPLAKTRTRRSNAGARMHEMIFAAEDDELLAQAYGILKGGDDSSDDEEYVPKDLEIAKAEDNEADGGDGDNVSGSGSDNESSEGTSSSGSDDDDDDDDEDDDDDDDEEDDDYEEDEDEEEEVEEGNENHKSEDGIGSRIALKREIGAGFQKISPDQNSDFKQNINFRHTIQPGSPTKAAYDSCAKICSVCLGDQSDEDDEIIECDMCGVSVHESCYGVSGEEHVGETTSVHSGISSESTEPWFCEPCKRSVKDPFCELCPNKGGIFKQTDTGRWIHMVCALYTRGITFENVDNLSEVSLFELNYQLYGSKVRFKTNGIFR